MRETLRSWLVTSALVVSLPGALVAQEVFSRGGSNACRTVLDPPVCISGPTLPLSLFSRNAPPDLAYALRARAAAERNGQPPFLPTTATAIVAEAVTNDPFSLAHASGLVVSAVAMGADTTAVAVDAFASADDCTGVLVVTSGFQSSGVRAIVPDVLSTGLEAFGGGFGVVGQGSNFGVFAQGDLGASGVKSFLQPDPTTPERVIQFVCLEGNESGTYFRGTTRLVEGEAEIEIPGEWRLASDADGITVQVTPLGRPASLYVAERSRERIVVRGEPDCTFDYFVNGVRRGFTKHEVYRDNTFFRPEVRGIPYGAEYPAELRDVLVQNGTLNPDYTPNEATLARLGWELVDPEEVPVEERTWLPADEFARLVEAKRTGASR